MTMVVRPTMSRASAALTAASLSTSSALVASSRTKTCSGGAASLGSSPDLKLIVAAAYLQCRGV